MQIEAIMRELRKKPPARLAGTSFEKVYDYKAHEVRELPRNQKTSDLPEPSANMMIFEAVSAARRFKIAARPSGTEPKIKFYFFAQAEPVPSQPLDKLKRDTDAAMSALQHALSEWIRSVIARGDATA
jgi:phosphoglucomutase/phosphomannomutase